MKLETLTDLQRHFAPEQASVIAPAFDEANAQLVTKGDLELAIERLRIELKSDMEHLRVKLKTDVERVRGEVERVRSDMYKALGVQTNVLIG